MSRSVFVSLASAAVVVVAAGVFGLAHEPLIRSDDTMVPRTITYETYSDITDPLMQTNRDAVSNKEPPTEAITFESQEFGLRMSIPYNPKWGFNGYSIPPYELITDNGKQKLIFGPLRARSAASFARTASIELVTEPASIPESFTDVPDDVIQTDEFALISGERVEVFEVGGSCTGTMFKITTPANSIAFVQPCDHIFVTKDGWEFRADATYLESVVRRMEFAGQPS